MNPIVSFAALIIFVAIMHGVSDAYNTRILKAETARLETSLRASRQASEFYESCRPSSSEWVKVECGQGVMRCVRLKINRDRINERETVVVGPALEFCKPSDLRGE